MQIKLMMKINTSMIQSVFVSSNQQTMWCVEDVGMEDVISVQLLLKCPQIRLTIM